MRKGEYSEFAMKCINFILNDIEKRGETVLGEIQFMVGLFLVKVKNPAGKRIEIMYSAASEVSDDYRKIILE